MRGIGYFGGRRRSEIAAGAVFKCLKCNGIFYFTGTVRNRDLVDLLTQNIGRHPSRIEKAHERAVHHDFDLIRRQVEFSHRLPELIIGQR